MQVGTGTGSALVGPSIEKLGLWDAQITGRESHQPGSGLPVTLVNISWTDVTALSAIEDPVGQGAALPADVDGPT